MKRVHETAEPFHVLHNNLSRIFHHRLWTVGPLDAALISKSHLLAFQLSYVDRDNTNDSKQVLYYFVLDLLKAAFSFYSLPRTDVTRIIARSGWFPRATVSLVLEVWHHFKVRLSMGRDIADCIVAHWMATAFTRAQLEAACAPVFRVASCLERWYSEEGVDAQKRRRIEAGEFRGVDDAPEVTGFPICWDASRI